MCASHAPALHSSSARRDFSNFVRQAVSHGALQPFCAFAPLEGTTKMSKKKGTTLLELAEMADSWNQTAVLKGEVNLFTKDRSTSVAEARQIVHRHSPRG